MKQAVGLITDPGGNGEHPGDECIAQVEVISFTANPQAIRPGESTTLSWQCTLPTGCPIGLYLNGTKVSQAGSQSFTLTQPRTFFLQARSLGRQGNFQPGVTVQVNTSACLPPIPVSEQAVRTSISETIRTSLDSDPKVYGTGEPDIQLTTDGIRIRTKSKFILAGPDPDLTLTVVVRISAISGTPTIVLRKLAVDLDWPWWFDVATLGLDILLLESSLESKIREGLDPALRNNLQALANQALANQVPAGYLLSAVTHETDQMNLLVCPRP